MKNNRVMIADGTGRGGELQLWEHVIGSVKEYELVINGVFIMATYNALSSELLVRSSLRRLRPRGGSLLIGGLGLGFSVREAIRFPGEIASIHVVEYDPLVIEWNRTLLRDLNGGFLSDSRVRVINDDFLRYVGGTAERYDIICMDIDNGPMLLVNEQNGEAYSTAFFTRIRELLRPKGIFAVWSCNEDRRLQSDLASIFRECDMEAVTENHHGREVPYYLYFTQKADKG